MNNDDLSVIAASVAEELFKTLYGDKTLDIVEVDQKMAYCASVTDFVLKTFKTKVEEAINE